MNLSKTEVRCPHCNMKLAEFVEGLAMFTCRRCKKATIIDSRATVVVQLITIIEYLMHLVAQF